METSLQWLTAPTSAQWPLKTIKAPAWQWQCHLSHRVLTSPHLSRCLHDIVRFTIVTDYSSHRLATLLALILFLILFCSWWWHQLIASTIRNVDSSKLRDKWHYHCDSNDFIVFTGHHVDVRIDNTPEAVWVTWNINDIAGMRCAYDTDMG